MDGVSSPPGASPGHVVVRRATSEDDFQVLYDLRLGWHPYDGLRDGMRRSVGRDTVVLAFVDTTPVGFAQVGHHPGGWPHVLEGPAEDSAEVTTWVSWLYVVPSHRGQGVGERLIEALVDEARKARSVMIALMPDESDADVETDSSVGLDRRRRFFEKVGFTLATPAGSSAGQEPWIYYRMITPLIR